MVTAIITTHNRKNLVLKAIASVENQSYKNIEIIVVDDHSTDGTKEIIEEYIKNTSIRYIYNTDDLGGNHIRNLGILESKGELVAFLDDDDEWMPEKIEKQVSYLQENPNVGVVVCGRILRVENDECSKSDLSQLPDGDYREKIFKGGFFPTSCLLAKKELIINCGLFDESLKYWQDYELYMRLAQITDFGSVKDYLVLFQLVSTNQSTKRLTYNLDGWEESVAYINKKHRDKISQLPEDILKDYKLFTVQDGCGRSQRSGNKKKLHYYLKELYHLEPNVKNFIKLLVNNFYIKESIKHFF